MKDEELFFPTKKKNKQASAEVLDELYKIPKKDKGVNAPMFQKVAVGRVHQADLLYLPHDENNKYALVVIDAGNRKLDAEPLKEKTSAAVLAAIKKIYARKILQMPSQRIEVDSGTEFKGEFAKWFADKKVFVRYGKPGRHRQQALVERANQTIGKALHRRMAAQELLTGETSREWIADLPKLVKIMNERAEKRKIVKMKNVPTCSGAACKIIVPGTKVRAIAEQPRDPVTGKVLPGRFRSTDFRWDPRIRIVKEVLLKPGSPPMYLLDGTVGKRNVEPVAYTKAQLQIVDANEQYPTKEVIRGKPTTYIVEKLLAKKKEKGKIKYLTKWRGFKKPTWEHKAMLAKDVPDILREFEENLE